MLQKIYLKIVLLLFVLIKNIEYNINIINFI